MAKSLTTDIDASSQSEILRLRIGRIELQVADGKIVAVGQEQHDLAQPGDLQQLESDLLALSVDKVRVDQTVIALRSESSQVVITSSWDSYVELTKKYNIDAKTTTVILTHRHVKGENAITLTDQTVIALGNLDCPYISLNNSRLIVGRDVTTTQLQLKARSQLRVNGDVSANRILLSGRSRSLVADAIRANYVGLGGKAKLAAKLFDAHFLRFENSSDLRISEETSVEVISGSGKAGAAFGSSIAPSETNVRDRAKVVVRGDFKPQGPFWLIAEAQITARAVSDREHQQSRRGVRVNTDLPVELVYADKRTARILR